MSPAELSCCALAKPLEGAPGNQQACAQIPGISEDTGHDPAQGVLGQGHLGPQGSGDLGLLPALRPGAGEGLVIRQVPMCVWAVHACACVCARSCVFKDKL